MMRAHERQFMQGMDMHTCNYSDAPDARFTNAQTKTHFAPDRSFTPTQVKLELRVDVKKKHVDGICTTHIELLDHSTETIGFDAVGMDVQKVLVNGKNVKFDYDKKQIRIPAKNMRGKAIVQVHYSLHQPKLGIYFIHPTKEQPNKPWQAWSHSEATEARHWYPCQDVPETKCPVEIHVSVPQPFKAISNGDLVQVKQDKKTNWNTYSWKFSAPNPSYLNAFMVGDFAEIKEKAGKVELYYYCEKGKEKDMHRSFAKTPHMLRVMTDFAGYPYPHKKYAQVAVADFIFGGMEHTTCTTLTDEAIQDEIADRDSNDWPETLGVHELAHQWFGDLITCKEWKHSWLNEGFARYSENIWQEAAYGKDAYDYEVYDNLLVYQDEDKNKYRRPIVTNTYADPSDLFDRHLYEKGALILHMMRGILGKEKFKQAVHAYVKKFAYKNATTEDFIEVIRHTTGKNLTQFMEQFLYQGGQPDLRISNYYNKKEHKLTVRVIQAQQGEAYSFPLEIAITQSNKRVRVEKKHVDGKEHRFEFKLPAAPLNVVVDPEMYVLKTATTVKPRNMWAYQLQHDDHIVQRIYAGQELAKYASPEDLRLLNAALRNDESWMVRGNIALAFAGIRLPQAAEMLLHAYPSEKKPRVKRAIINALAEHKTPEVREFLLREAQRRDSYIIPAEAYRSLGARKDPNEMQILEEGLKRDAWYDAIRTASISGLGQLQSEEAYRRVLSLLHPKHSNFVRMAASRVLGSIGRGREETQWKLLEHVRDPYSLIGLFAITSIGDVGDARIIPELEKITNEDLDARIKKAAFDCIRKINGGVDLPSWKEKKTDEKKE